MDLYEVLKKLNIQYKEIEHEKVYTVEEAQNLKLKIDGTGCKNLFLTDKKGTYLLVTLKDDKKADIKEISKITNTKHLSFAKCEELNSILNLEQGSVTPIGIINDIDNKVIVLIDKDLSGKKVLIHPNINSKTISIKFEDLVKFIEFENHKLILI